MTIATYRSEDSQCMRNASEEWSLRRRPGLGWHESAGGTCRILLEAGRHLGSRAAENTVMTDSGAENVNGNVDALLDREGLRRVLAQVEVSFSNSMIEAFWRSLRRLYLHNLDNKATLRRLIEFYVRAHIPFPMRPLMVRHRTRCTSATGTRWSSILLPRGRGPARSE
jgi:transposase InsO family protein